MKIFYSWLLVHLVGAIVINLIIHLHSSIYNKTLTELNKLGITNEKVKLKANFYKKYKLEINAAIIYMYILSYFFIYLPISKDYSHLINALSQNSESIIDKLVVSGILFFAILITISFIVTSFNPHDGWITALIQLTYSNLKLKTKKLENKITKPITNKIISNYYNKSNHINTNN